jgi:hypothetical protein
MSIMFRAVMILVCAYAGWETAGLQIGELPEVLQTMRSSSSSKAGDETPSMDIQLDEPPSTNDSINPALQQC